MKRGVGIRRGVIALVLLAVATAGIFIAPVEAAFRPTKAKIKKIARKEATKVLQSTGVELFRLRCPADTVGLAGTCFEAGERGPQTWGPAASTCGTLGRRLPTLSELITFANSGVSSGLPWTGMHLSGNLAFDSGGDFWGLGVFPAGDFNGFAISTARSFRCVVDAVN